MRLVAREAVERREWPAAYQALRGLEDPSGGDLELLAEVARWSRPLGEQIECLELACASFTKAADTLGAARCLLKLVREHYERGDMPVASGCLLRAASLLADLPESPEHAFLAWNVARAALVAGDVEELVRSATEAAEIARRTGNADVEALATLDLGHALVATGRVDEGRALMDEANAAAASGVLGLQAAGTIYCSTIWACRNLGDWRRASAWTDVSLRWCERERVGGFPGQCRFHRAEVLRMRGALDDAEVDARRAIAELEGRPRLASWGYMELGEIRRRRGDFEGAEEAFRTALDLGTDPQPGYALLRLAQMRVAEARAMIERALAPVDVIARQERVLVLPAAMTIALADGDRDAACVMLDELRDVAARIETVHGDAAVAGAEGELALADGRPSDAVTHLRRAWELWCAAEAPYEAARSRVLVGRAHLLAGDQPAARVEWTAALSTFERLGAHRDADEVRAVLLEADDSVAGPVRARVEMTFVFIDMVNSTPLVEFLGDEAWSDLLGWYERIVKSVVEVHDGTIVGQEGDGFFVTFADPVTAVRCAKALQQRLAAQRQEQGFAPRIRIGLHTSEADRRGDDYAGLGIHTAARIASCAQGDEILASSDTAREVSTEPIEVTSTRTVTLKGISAPLEIVTIAWKAS